MYSKVTHDVKISVIPEFLTDKSVPHSRYFVWAYHVQIENLRADTVQLIGRYWQITDARGLQQEVHGEGVVGEQPTLHPGEMFEYTSGTPLHTPSGIMLGRYEMQTEQGQRFEVDIPAFSLDSQKPALVH
jgi:ApaG protein